MAYDNPKWVSVATTKSNGDNTMKGSDLSGMMVWVTPSGEHPRSAEVLAEGEGKLVNVVKE